MWSSGNGVGHLVVRLVVAATICLAALPPAPAAAAEPALVLAMYYAWFDSSTWGSGKLSDQPSSPYISADRGVIERQVTQAQSAGIDGFELNWWGPGNPTDSNLQTLLSVAGAHGFKVTADFDLNSPFVHNPGDATNVLSYLKRYFGDSSWLRWNGKPVVVFYGNRRFDVGTWAAIRNQVDPDHQAIWIGEGDVFSYLSVFDGIHPYSIAWSPNPSGQLASYAKRARSYPGKLWMATVMPGYDDTRLGRPNGFAVDRQDGAYYTHVWQGAIATHPDLISITSWNEWLEGTQIEPSRSYGDRYLQLTRQMSDQYKAIPVSTVPSSSQTGAGTCFSEAAQGGGVYCVTNDSGILFDDAFRWFGGVSTLGYPSTQRFVQGGLVYQAMQGAVLQWRPDYGHSVLANTFEWFTEAGKDDYLLATAGVPKPIRDDGSGGDWQKAKQTRLSWLTDDAIRQKFLSAGSVDRAIELYGLPMSRPERHGPFITQRFQRIAFQHWVDPVPGMPPPGSVVRVLGGDLLKQVGMIPSSATEPSPR